MHVDGCVAFHCFLFILFTICLLFSSFDGQFENKLVHFFNLSNKSDQQPNYAQNYAEQRFEFLWYSNLSYLTSSYAIKIINISYDEY